MFRVLSGNPNELETLWATRIRETGRSANKIDLSDPRWTTDVLSRDAREYNRRGSVSVIDEEREQSCMKYDTETLGRVADDDVDFRDQGRLKFYLFDRIRILLFFIRRIEISWAAWDRLGK